MARETGEKLHVKLEKPAEMATQPAGREPTLIQLPVETLQPGPYQPRRLFSLESLEELADSIRVSGGVIQPIIVRSAGGGMYNILAGERRWRASKLAGRRDVTCIIRDDIGEEGAAFITLTENVQREDLTPIEEANSYQMMIDRFRLDQRAVAEGVGKARSSVANALRLLSLPKEIQALLADKDSGFTAGHARPLVGLPEGMARQLAATAIKSGLSVREVEARAREITLMFGGKEGQGTRAHPRRAPETVQLEQALNDFFACPVRIDHDEKGAGELRIRFTSVEVFEGILDHLKGFRSRNNLDR